MVLVQPWYTFSRVSSKKAKNNENCVIVKKSREPNTAEEDIMATYTTHITAQPTSQPPTIGVERWIVQRMIGDYAIKTIHTKKCPTTNRGHQKEIGWLGSWNNESKVARGKCRLIEATPIHDYPDRKSYDDYGSPVIVGYKLTWIDEQQLEVK